MLLPTNGWITGPYCSSVMSHPLFMQITMLQFDASSKGKKMAKITAILEHVAVSLSIHCPVTSSSGPVG